MARIDKRNSDHAVDEWGHEGNDTILGSRFGDTLRGAQGNDTIHGNGGDDQIFDITWIGVAPDFGNLVLFSRGETTDAMRRFVASFIVEDFEISARDLGQTLFHGGNDKFYGGAGHDFLIGFEGYDYLEGGTGRDALLGGSGRDTLVGGSSTDILGGGSGNDYLLGGTGDDLLDGGAGDDTLEGGAGADTLIGDFGIDTATYSQSAGAVFIDLSQGIATPLTPAFSEAAGDTFESIENIEGSRGNDSLIGDDIDNVLFGGLGDDTLAGGEGADDILGGDGNDTADYAGSDEGVRVSLRNGNLTAIVGGGDAHRDFIRRVENIGGSDHGDILAGNDQRNTLLGRDGDDRLSGGSANDRLFGGNGGDVLNGGSEADFLSGSAGGDRISGQTGIDTVSFLENARGMDIALGEAGLGGTATTSIGEGETKALETDRLFSVENIDGSNFADIIRGNSEKNIINGFRGDDIFHFSVGGDVYDGGRGVDFLDLSDLPGSVVVTLSASMQFSSVVPSGNQDPTATLRGLENVDGTNFNDQITGDGADNVIDGRGGSDLLAGGGGDDTFVFNSIAEIGLTGANRDRILDFSEGDVIDLRGVGASKTNPLDLSFIGNGAFNGVAGEMRAVVSSGGDTDLLIDFDGNRVADASLGLSGVEELRADHLLF